MDYFICVIIIINVILSGDEIDCKMFKNLEIFFIILVKEVFQIIQNEMNMMIS